MNRKERDLDELSCFLVLGFFAGFIFCCCSGSLLLDPARALACLHVNVILRCTGEECRVGRSGALLRPRCLDFTHVLLL
jgi:hypothetical protein